MARTDYDEHDTTDARTVPAWLRRLLIRMDREMFRPLDNEQPRALPLERRKVEWHVDAQPGS